MLRLIDALIWRAAKFGVALTSSLSLLVSTAVADTPLDPQLIIELKEGHLRSCTQTITEQLRSIGYEENEAIAKEYCLCIGIMYFNDFTEADFDELQRETGGLPQRIEANRKAIQEYCADIHLSGL